MSKTLEELLSDVTASVDQDDFITIALLSLEEIRTLPESFRAIEPLLHLMESHPEADFGSPGPIVHFAEEFYGKGYEEILVQSIQRKPTGHTLWMLNRIVNTLQGKQKESYLTLFDQVYQNNTVDLQVRETAKEFLELHEG